MHHVLGGIWMQVDFHNYRDRSRTCYPEMIPGWFSVPLTYHISAYYGCAKGVAQVDFHAWSLQHRIIFQN